MALPKTPPSNVNRQPQGVPVGGQFAATAHSESGVTLPTAKGHFSNADNDPDIEKSLSADAPTGDAPTYDLLGASGGSGGQPPSGGGNGGSGGGDDAEREASVGRMTETVKHFTDKLQDAKTICVSARDTNGTVCFDEVLDFRGTPLWNSKELASSMTFQLNSSRPGGGGTDAVHVIGDHKSASLDVEALKEGQIRIVGFGMPPAK